MGTRLKQKNSENYGKSAVIELKRGKSCGEDGIVPEVLKWIPIDDHILDIINKAYTGHELPAKWTISNTVPIPKSGDLTKTDNYELRGNQSGFGCSKGL